MLQINLKCKQSFIERVKQGYNVEYLKTGELKMIFNQDCKKKLLEAIKFCKSAQKKNGLKQQQFCKIENNELSVADDYCALGSPLNLIKDEWDQEPAFPDCNPNTFEFETVLKLIKFDFQIVCEVNSIKLICLQTNAIYKVGCIESNKLISLQPDLEHVEISEDFNFKSMVANLGSVAGSDKSNPNYCCVYLDKNFGAATDRKIAMQFYHAQQLPFEGFILKEHAVAIGKKTGNVFKIGFDTNSITFYFEKGNWFKCCLFKYNVINYNKIMEQHAVLDSIDLSCLITEQILKHIKSIDKKSILHFNDDRIEIFKNNIIVFSKTIETLKDNNPGKVLIPLEHLIIAECTSLNYVFFDKNKLICQSNSTRCAIAYVE